MTSPTQLVDATTGFDTDIPGELFLLEALFLLADVFLWRREAIKKVMDGLQSIFEKDNIRKCRVEASSFVAAYLLGVPLLCYRPSRESVSPEFIHACRPRFGLAKLSSPSFVLFSRWPSSELGTIWTSSWSGQWRVQPAKYRSTENLSKRTKRSL